MSEEKKTVEKVVEKPETNDEKKEVEKTDEPVVEKETVEPEAPSVEDQLKQTQGALQEERIKRKQAYELLNNLKPKEKAKEPEEEIEYDQEEIAKADKLLQKLGYIKEKDREQKTVSSKNKQVYDTFMSEHQDLFGVDGSATPEQDANWNKVKAYLGDYFDLNKNEDFLSAKNLSKKLNKSLEDLLGKAKADELIEKGKTLAQTEKANADKLALGDGGGSTPSKKATWKYNTTSKEAYTHLRNSGYSEDEAKEMLADAGA